MSILRSIRQNPFSVMALCNILGDLGYLGFAFATEGIVSPPKLAGALFTLLAHAILLAYGDDQARHISKESGLVASTVLNLRRYAKCALTNLPARLLSSINEKPIGIAFAMLAMNGAGLLADALTLAFTSAALAQILLGACIIIGCVTFSFADFLAKQHHANILLKIAPMILAGATCANVWLALTTGNCFLILSILSFAVANFAGFYARIDKNPPISAGI